MIPVYVCQQQQIGQYQQQQDCLDRQWWSFLLSADLQPVLLPNDPGLVRQLLANPIAHAVILTGSGEYDSAGKDERSATEQVLMAWSLQHNIPMIGVCRGMQAMLQYCGGSLVKVAQHVATQHKIRFLQQSRWVNSYHQFGCYTVPNNFSILAVATDNVVKAVEANDRAWLGIMWHPERLSVYDNEDLQLFKNFISGNQICKR